MRASIDVDRALELWSTCHNWHTVASQMIRSDGKAFTAMSVYLACWRARRLPEDSQRKRPDRRHAENNDGSHRGDSNLGHIWQPGKERWVPLRPDYKTNRVVPNERPGAAVPPPA